MSRLTAPKASAARLGTPRSDLRMGERILSPREIRRRMLVHERLRPAVLAGDLDLARRRYDTFSNAKDFGSFEHLIDQITREHFHQRLSHSQNIFLRRQNLCDITSTIKNGDLNTLIRMACTDKTINWLAKAVVARYTHRSCRTNLQTKGYEIHSFLTTLAPNILLSARAGSGKTYAIAVKYAQLRHIFNLPDARMMALAFNKKAASELRNRIRQYVVNPSNINARTFHSLAYGIVRPIEKLLLDDDLLSFIGNCRRDVWSDEISMQIHNLFRTESHELASTGEDLDPIEYYIYRRSLAHRTLRGEMVRSSGEKWISDFLFEYNIFHEYERPVLWDGDIYRPDFTINASGRSFILEHWSIDPSHDSWSNHYDDSINPVEYRAQIERKRRYWRDQRRILLETSVGDMRAGREAFELTLRRRLECAGIVCRRLDDAEIAKRVSRHQVPRLDEMLASFIRRARKARLPPDALAQLRLARPTSDPRTHIFEDLALRVYRRYETRKADEGKIDFDDLLERAAKQVQNTDGKCTIHRTSMPVRDIDWLFVDEFQDFSAQFNKMVDSLRVVNPSIHVIAVGDDWQAINGFAGSDVGYFRDFERTFAGGQRVALLTNRRSDRAIVQLGNVIMQGHGEPARAAADRPAGETRLCFIDDVRIERRDGPRYERDRDRDAVYVSRTPAGVNRSNRAIVARALKLCHVELLRQPRSSHLLLSRTNSPYGIRQTDFLAALRACFADDELAVIGRFEDRVRIMTAHKSKGLEAERVILLEAVEGKFPLLHSDEPLYRLVGKRIADVLEEERRLFYVACTRAKHSLVILSERDRVTPFLESARRQGIL